jgi:anaerobic magnesium-protoporphyrin IX monomethyl ester cyclase
MNVLLVSPYQGAMFELAGVNMQPLGISYIGAALRAAGHDVQLEIMQSQNVYPDFAGADIVGISCNTVQFKSGLKIAKAAKALGKTVIMGGPHPTTNPEEALQSGYVDYVVRAEGEVTIVELLRGLQTGKEFIPEKVLGISYIDKESGKIVSNPNRPFIHALDQIPFPMREAKYRYNKDISSKPNGSVTFPIVTTRGCPYGCKFCQTHVLAGRRFRIRSIENVVKEVEQIVKKYNPEEIVFIDDIINFDSERLVSLFGRLIEKGLPVIKWVMGRADLLIENPKTAEVMGKGGVQQMFLGIESPSEHVLKAYRKGGKASSNASVKAVQILKQNGIETWGAFIIGAPQETMEDIKRTIEFAKFLNPGTAEFSILTPYPGTELWDEVKPRIFTQDWDLYDALHPVFKTDHISPDELRKALVKAYVSFYMQPKRIWKSVFSRGTSYGSTNIKKGVRIVKALRTVLQNEYPRTEKISISPSN